MSAETIVPERIDGEVQIPTVPFPSCDFCGEFCEDGFDMTDEWEFVCSTCQRAAACPYCGEIGGEPVTVYSREYQGESPHGGMVEFAEERCSKCRRAA